jgi:hypothetical protein
MQPSPLTRLKESAGSERRRPRVAGRLPVNLAVGCDAPVPAITADVSPHGALILSFIPVTVGTVIWLQNARTKVWVRARVVWHARRRHLGPHQLGIELLGTAPNLWAEHDGL